MPKHSGCKTTRQTARTKGKPYPRLEGDDSGNNSAEEHTEPSNCPVCEEVIKEPTDKAPGDEAIFCEGQCEAWFHRKCAGISKKVYESTSESDNPFYCILCLQTYFNNEISQLKQQISVLVSKIPNLAEDKGDQQPHPVELSSQTSNSNVQSSSVNLKKMPLVIPTKQRALRIGSSISFCLACRSVLKVLKS